MKSIIAASSATFVSLVRQCNGSRGHIAGDPATARRETAPRPISSEPLVSSGTSGCHRVPCACGSVSGPRVRRRALRVRPPTQSLACRRCHDNVWQLCYDTVHSRTPCPLSRVLRNSTFDSRHPRSESFNRRRRQRSALSASSSWRALWHALKQRCQTDDASALMPGVGRHSRLRSTGRRARTLA